MKAILKTCALGAAAVLLSTGVQATEEIDNNIEYRQDVLGVMAWQVDTLGAMAQGDVDYDAEVFKLRADNLAALAHMPWEGFVEGSFRGGDHSVDTGALAKIADNMDDFTAKGDDLVAETATLAELAGGDDFTAMRRQVAKVGQTCKGCHDEYRAE
jgi:cytochrome c556